MPKAIQRTARNQSIECCKLIAAIFVVFIHVPFPGRFGTVVCCLARFAVPMFFCVSGYFNFQASSRQISRRLEKILRILLITLALTILWSCCAEGISSLREVLRYVLPDANGLMKWLILHSVPYNETNQLWYLMSLIVCYLVLWAYTCFCEAETICYRPLYYAGFTLFVIHFTLAYVLPMNGVEIPYWAYRNGWFTGLPMFLMGMFLHEYQEKLLRCFRLTDQKLWGIFLIGLVLSLAQWKSGSRPEIPLGTLMQIPALLLILVRRPRVPWPWLGWLSGKFGTLSTGVYVSHLMMNSLYERCFLLPMEGIFAGSEPWLRPVLVVLMSLLAAILWMFIASLRLRKSK